MRSKRNPVQEVFPYKLHASPLATDIPPWHYDAHRKFRIRDPEVGETVRLRKKLSLEPAFVAADWLMRIERISPDREDFRILTNEIHNDGTFNQDVMIVLTFTAEMLMFMTAEKRLLRRPERIETGYFLPARQSSTPIY